MWYRGHANDGWPHVGMLSRFDRRPDTGFKVKSSRFTSRLIFDDLIFNPLKIPEAKHFYVTLEQTTIWYRTGNFFKLQNLFGEIELKETILSLGAIGPPDDIEAGSPPMFLLNLAEVRVGKRSR